MKNWRKENEERESERERKTILSFQVKISKGSIMFIHIKALRNKKCRLVSGVISCCLIFISPLLKFFDPILNDCWPQVLKTFPIPKETNRILVGLACFLQIMTSLNLSEILKYGAQTSTSALQKFSILHFPKKILPKRCVDIKNPKSQKTLTRHKIRK